MSEETKQPPPRRMVVVVGVDLSDVSGHLLARARDLVRSVDNAELHLVHVIPDPLLWAAEPPHRSVLDTRPQMGLARQRLQLLCDSVLKDSRARIILHTPVGRTADEVTRIARQVGADIIVVEMHERAGLRRVFHHSVVARITRTAPCSVLAIRDPSRVASQTRARQPEMASRAASS
jgi:nucleotide-binding universal stress UspA family protein